MSMFRLLAAGVLLLLVSAAAVGAAAELDCPPRIVAVFDIGSGTTRMQVADLADCLDAAPRSVLRWEVPLGFSADLAEHGESGFSAAMLAQAASAMAEMVDAARAAGAEELFGVATAAFRRADNAPAVLEDWHSRFGVEIEIIDQNEEGRLAYRMIELALNKDQPLVVWDIGAGSQQLVWRNPADGRFEHFNSRLAAVSFRNLAVSELARPEGAYSPNPISADEAQRLRAAVRTRLGADLPGDLLELIRGGARIVGIGGVHGASLVEQAGLQAGAELSRACLSEVLDDRLGLDDAAIGGEYADTQVTNLILVLALMEIYGIESYRATRADLTDALLITAVGRASPSVLNFQQ